MPQAQSRAVQGQFAKRNEGSYDRPVTEFYDVPVDDLIYRDPFKPSVK